MSKLQSYGVLIFLALGVGLLAFIAFDQSDVSKGEVSQSWPESDRREEVTLNHDQLQFALGQMRGFLNAIQELDAAEQQGDLEKMAELARVHGPGIKRNRPEGFRARLPDGFRAISGPMRKGFAEMASHLEAGDLEAYRATRLETLGACNACHEAYRFQVEQ